MTLNKVGDAVYKDLFLALHENNYSVDPLHPSLYNSAKGYRDVFKRSAKRLWQLLLLVRACTSFDRGRFYLVLSFGKHSNSFCATVILSRMLFD